MSQRFSLHTPVFADASAVNSDSFKLDAEAIARILHWHPHAALVANGARFGFSLMSDGAVRRQEWPNPRVTADEAAQVTAWIEKQKANGHTVEIPEEEIEQLVGVFVSPVALAPKAGGAEGEKRICHDMSAGGSKSVNSGIDFDPLNPIGLLQLESVVARIQFMRAQHPTRKIMASKCDLKEFFRQIPLRRRDMARVVQRWDGVVYAHEAFTFGSSSAPHICSVVTNALCDELARRGIYCQCFIDDCVLLAYGDEIDAAVEVLRKLIKEFGLLENEAKFVPLHSSWLWWGCSSISRCSRSALHRTSVPRPCCVYQHWSRARRQQSDSCEKLQASWPFCRQSCLSHGVTPLSFQRRRVTPFALHGN
jgi:hypothetical protein